MRVTGGELAGRRLLVPRGGGVRPTSDRVREALFARVGDLEGVRALDLYAGTGALGIEALSRGARDACFVERSAAAVSCLERNLASLGLAGRARVLRAEVRAARARLAREALRFDLVLVDPPYDDAGADRELGELVAAGLLAPGALVVREASRRHPPGAVPGLVRCDERRYGDTLVVRYTSPGAETSPGSDCQREPAE